MILNFEKEIKKAFYKDEREAERLAETRAGMVTDLTNGTSSDDLVD